MTVRCLVCFTLPAREVGWAKPGGGRLSGVCIESGEIVRLARQLHPLGLEQPTRPESLPGAVITLGQADTDHRKQPMGFVLYNWDSGGGNLCNHPRVSSTFASTAGKLDVRSWQRGTRQEGTAGMKQKQKAKSKKKSTYAGFEPTRVTPVDFESTALTARPICHKDQPE